MLRSTDKDLYLAEYSQFCTARRGYLCPRQDMEANRQLAGKLVPAAPAFPLPSAILAERVSDRERKGRGEQPTVQSVFALRQDMETERRDILGKAADGVERDLVRVATDILALGQDAVGHRDDLATAGFCLVNVNELARGRPQDLAVGLCGGLLDRLRHKRNGGRRRYRRYGRQRAR